jgi:hypothetical protein
MQDECLESGIIHRWFSGTTQLGLLAIFFGIHVSDLEGSSVQRPPLYSYVCGTVEPKGLMGVKCWLPIFPVYRLNSFRC